MPGRRLGASGVLDRVYAGRRNGSDRERRDAEGRTRAVAAGAAYFGVMFGLGFLLGPVRELVLLPRMGPLAAVGVEAVPMLLGSALAAGWLVRRFGVPGGTGARVVMGGTGLALLVAAETLFTWLLRGRGPGPGWWVDKARSADGLLSLALMLGFAAMPLLVARRRR